MYELTKDDVTILRKANDCVVHLSARDPEGVVRFIQRLAAGDKETTLPVPVTEYKKGRYVNGRYELLGSHFAMVNLYPWQGTKTPATTILHSLRAGDSVCLEFSADAHSNEYARRAGLHADVLYLYVKRKGAKDGETFELATGLCPENSARMCKGVPFDRHDGYEEVSAALAGS